MNADSKLPEPRADYRVVFNQRRAPPSKQNNAIQKSLLFAIDLAL